MATDGKSDEQPSHNSDLDASSCCGSAESEVQSEPVEQVPAAAQPTQTVPSAEPEKFQGFQRWFELNRTTPASTLLLSLNIAMFVSMVLQEYSKSGPMVILLPDAIQLIDWGALYAPSTLQGEYWRLVSSQFLHAGILHLGMNMYVLWYVGPLVERLYGSWKFSILYLLAGVGGAINTLLWTPAAVGVGASGAIYGVFGGVLAFFQAHRADFPPDVFRQKVRGLLIFLLISLAAGAVSPMIGNAAHIGGLAVGYLIGLAIMPKEPTDLRWHQRDTLRTAPLVVLFVALMYFQTIGTFDFGGELSLVRAVGFLKDGKYKEALPLLDKRIKLVPDDTRAYAARVAAYGSLEQYKNAISDCDKILHYEHRNVSALISRANAYGHLGQHKKAIDDVNTALKYDRNIPNAQAILGWDELALGQYRTAIDHYSRAIAARPGLTFVYNSLTYAHFSIKDYNGAVEYARKFLHAVGWQDHNSAYPIIMGALSYRAIGDSKAAQQMLDDGISHLDQSNWQYQIVRYLSGDISADKLESLSDDLDKKTEAKTYIGLQLAFSGKKADAIPYFNWVIEHGNKEFFEYLLSKAQLENGE
jgi:membrane associated rhomboid family serine protease/tetratricopeptide (TPR) repeat protein